MRILLIVKQFINYALYYIDTNIKIKYLYFIKHLQGLTRSSPSQISLEIYYIFVTYLTTV